MADDNALRLPRKRASALDPASATVCVVMPVRNEAAHIEESLASVVAQTFDKERLEILVVDGLSEDETVAIARRIIDAHPHSDIVINPRRTTVTSLNLGIERTAADIITRVDGHCRLDIDYIQRCVDLLCETGAGNVGGLMRPEGQSVIGRAMALALCSKFGIGDSRFHYLERQEYVDSVYLGAFRREVLQETGLFDEDLLANEDFELNHRIREGGYGVLLSPAIRSRYYPRDTLASISRQFFRYGQWKARVMRKHPESVRPRHLVAPLFVAALLVGAPTCVITRQRWMLAPVGVYGIATMVAAIITARFDRSAAALCAVFPSMHLSWGWGVLVGSFQTLTDRSHTLPPEARSPSRKQGTSI